MCEDDALVCGKTVTSPAGKTRPSPRTLRTYPLPDGVGHRPRGGGRPRSIRRAGAYVLPPLPPAGPKPVFRWAFDRKAVQTTAVHEREFFYINDKKTQIYVHIYLCDLRTNCAFNA